MQVDSQISTELSARSGVSSFKRSFQSTGGNVIETAVIIPPDGGWGWVIVAASFLVNALVDGAVYTFAIFLQEIAVDFNVNLPQVTLASSLTSGMCFLSGPIVCAVVNHTGFRITGFIGGVITSLSYVAASFQVSNTPFVLILGVVGGFGIGMTYIPSVVVIGFYFSRWRSLATAIALTGSSVGVLSFPMIFKDLLSAYNWRTQFKIIGGCFFMASLISLLYKPLKPVYVAVKTDNVKSIQFITPPVKEVTSIYSRQNISGSGFFHNIFNRFHNVNYPTAAQLTTDSATYFSISGASSSSSMFLSNNALEGNASTSFHPEDETGPSIKGKMSKLSTVYEYDLAKPGKCKRCLKKYCCNCAANRAPVRPMYRDDALYMGPSLLTIVPTVPSIVIGLRQSSSRKPPQVDKVKSAVEYHMSVTRASQREIMNEENVYCWCCHENMIRTLVTMLNFSLLKSPSFFLLVLSGGFSVLGMYVPYIYLIEKSVECGINANKAKYFYIALGIANAIGRILCGFFTSIPHVTPLIVSCVTLFLAGFLTAISYFICSFYGSIIYACSYGLLIASLATLRSPIIVDLLGLEALTNGFGIALLFQGIAAFIGLPIAGFIVKQANEYKSAFLFSGFVILLSAFLLFPVNIVSDWEKKKKPVTKQ